MIRTTHLRRLGVVAVAAVATVGLSAGTSAAHFCYVNNMTPQAMAGAGNSNGFAPFGELAAQFTGLCPAGIQVLADAAGVSVSTPINVRVNSKHGSMGGGAQAQGKQPGGIAYLDFAAIEGAFPDAVAACQ